MRKILLLMLGFLLFASCGNRVEDLSPTDDGVRRTYWDNGRLKSESHYDGGKLNGSFKTWYDNGQLFQDGLYADGMMDGSWLIFYPNGQLAAKAQYEKGTGKQTCYNEDGCIIMEVNYADNQKDGPEIHYAFDGSVLQVVEYKQGKKIAEINNP